MGQRQDSRTPEQVAADDALTEAIEATLKAYAEDDDPGGVLMEYVVLTSQSSIDEDGDGVTTIASLPRDRGVPLHRLMGLADFALATWRANASSDE